MRERTGGKAMADTATSKTSQRHTPTWRGFAGFALTALALSTLAMAPASAASGCGTYSYGFEGTRLLNDGISNSAGPFAIDLPAGTYTVTLVAHDHHSTQPDVPSQANEQYRVVLDSGYVSPPSNDIPDSSDTTTTVFTGQVIGASSTISVTHVGLPGINSVDPICVGFTPEAAPESSDDDADEPSAEAPAEEPATEEPDAAEEPVEVEVKGIVEERDQPTATPAVPVNPDGPDATPAEPAPIQDIGDPIGIIRNPNVPAPDAAPAEPPPNPPVVTVAPVSNTADNTAQDTDPVPVEVAGIQIARQQQDPAPETQIPLLAITGPSTSSYALTGLALLFLAAGVALLHQERRLATVHNTTDQ